MKFSIKIFWAECRWHEDALRIHMSGSNHWIAWGLPCASRDKTDGQPQSWAGVRGHRTNPFLPSADTGDVGTVVTVVWLLWAGRKPSGSQDISPPADQPPGPFSLRDGEGGLRYSWRTPNHSSLRPSILQQGTIFLFSLWRPLASPAWRNFWWERIGMAHFFSSWNGKSLGFAGRVCMCGHTVCKRSAPKSPVSSRQSPEQCFNLLGSPSASLFFLLTRYMQLTSWNREKTKDLPPTHI